MVQRWGSEGLTKFLTFSFGCGGQVTRDVRRVGREGEGTAIFIVCLFLSINSIDILVNETDKYYFWKLEKGGGSEDTKSTAKLRGFRGEEEEEPGEGVEAALSA